MSVCVKNFFILVGVHGIKTTKQQVSDAERDFNWIDATLETYYVGTDCDLLPSGNLTYTFDFDFVFCFLFSCFFFVIVVSFFFSCNNSKIVLDTQNSKGDTDHQVINWDSVTGSTGCSGYTTANSSDVIIHHN